MRSLHLAAALAALSVPGCGGDDGGGERVLDCAWATSEDNCWLSLVDQIAQCAVPDGEVGVFDPTRTTCTYDGGWVVQFAEPYPSTAFDVTVTRDGAPCFRYTNRATEQGVLDLEVESGGQLVSASGSAGGSYTLTCPDGNAYVAPDAYAVLTCGEPRGYKIPGVLTSYTSGSAVGLSIPLGEEPGGADIVVPLFMCM